VSATGRLIIAGVSVQAEQPTSYDDFTRVRRLREDAQRAMSTNLAEGIALSHLLASFVGVAVRG
jgi:hypothetical protein